MKDCLHSDWLVHNMIVQGNELALIDGDDETYKCFFSDALLQAHLELMDLDDPKKIEHYIFHKLTKIAVTSRHIIRFLGQLFPPCPRIFDIGSYSESLINRYLGYGAKVFCCDPSTELTGKLSDMCAHEAIFSTQSILLQQKTGIITILDGMIALYGTPDFCNIHGKEGLSYNALKTLSCSSIPCIAFKFDVRHRDDMVLCLKYLISLGYKKFNFSVRDFPDFVLKNNRYTGCYKDWVCFADELLNEIDSFVQLDHQGEQLWGYIYARKDSGPIQWASSLEAVGS